MSSNIPTSGGAALVSTEAGIDAPFISDEGGVGSTSNSIVDNVTITAESPIDIGEGSGPDDDDGIRRQIEADDIEDRQNAVTAEVTPRKTTMNKVAAKKRNPLRERTPEEEAELERLVQKRLEEARRREEIRLRGEAIRLEADRAAYN